MTVPMLLLIYPSTKIYPIESPNVIIVGVGEATILALIPLWKIVIYHLSYGQRVADQLLSVAHSSNWRDDGLDIWQSFFPLVASSKGPSM